MNFRNLVIAIGGLLAITGAGSVQAQYMYLDSNDDGLSTADDTLRTIGEPTQIAIWLDTAHNRDGSPAICPQDSGGNSINSYEVILRATGGEVAYDGFANLQSNMTTKFGQSSDTHEFYAGYGGGTSNPPGRRKLGTLTVTGLSGTPALTIASSCDLMAIYLTSFGSGCLGADGENTMKLGTDWFNVDGCAPASGASSAPSITAPNTVAVRANEPISFHAEVTSRSSGQGSVVDVSGLPEGVVAINGPMEEGQHQSVRIYGLAPGESGTGSVRLIRWRASADSLTDSTLTRMSINNQGLSDAELEARVRALVSVDYIHGMPRVAARALGRRASPILARYLRDEAKRPYWGNVASALGFVGDTAFFDTLYDFVWNRFQGVVDRPTFKAARRAQASLSVMATISVRVREYLMATTKSEAWSGLNWRIPELPSGAMGDLLAPMSYQALGNTDHPDVADFLAREVALSTKDGLQFDRASAWKTVQEVRRRGFVGVWEARDRELGRAK